LVTAPATVAARVAEAIILGGELSTESGFVISNVHVRASKLRQHGYYGVAVIWVLDEVNSKALRCAIQQDGCLASTAVRAGHGTTISKLHTRLTRKLGK